MTLKERCPILQFADLGDERGKLVVIEGDQAIPFDIKRVFYIYDSDSTVVRGQHANKESEFVLINVAGRSKVRITDGMDEYVVELNKPMMGVYLPKICMTFPPILFFWYLQVRIMTVKNIFAIIMSIYQ